MTTEAIHMSEADQIEMAHAMLDNAGIPRTEGERELSLVARVSRLANPLDAKIGGNTMTETCKTCRFWKWNKYGDESNCLRYAPKPIVTTDIYAKVPLTLWPITLDEDWCGEHEPRAQD